MRRRYEVTVDEGLELRLAEGVVLRSTVWRPRGRGSYPVLLIRTPYNRQHGQDHVFAHPSWYASFGFAVVAQDVRGRWASDGVFDPFAAEGADGRESVEWAASRSFSSGRVGMMGMSYPGLTQLHAASQDPDPLEAIAPIMSAPNPYADWIYTNGAFALAFNVAWATFLAMDAARRLGDGAAELRLVNALAAYPSLYNHLPLRTFPGLEKLAPYFYEWLRHPHYDGYWAARDASGGIGAANVASFSLGGWYDVFLEGSIDAHARFRSGPAGAHAHLVLTPWWHGPHGRYIGELDFGAAAGAEWLDTRVVQFFARHLRDEDVANTPAVEAFVTGANSWQRFDTWPPGTKTTTYYIRSERGANSLNGDGTLTLEPPDDERPDWFTYDPAMPTPSLGGRSGGSSPITPVGPVDQRPVELSRGVLVYTSERLQGDLFVAGKLEGVLYAMTSARDTDWTIKVCDVSPDERAINVQETIWRASYGLEAGLEFLPANEVAEFTIPVGSLCHVFRKGHRIRLEISSSNFPHWDRNLNTGHPLGSDTLSDRVVATQAVFHETRYASRLLVPVVV